MRNTLATAAGLLMIIATLPYIIDTIKGRTRPRIVTWFTWGLLGIITTFAALSGHAVQTAIFAGALSLCDLAIVLAGLRHGLKHYTPFDVICQLLAIVGIILWQATSQPALAVLFVILSDLIGALPTYHHIWLDPYEETLSTYTLGTISAVLVIISLASFKFVASGYPIYILASCASLVGLIIYRRYLRVPVTTR